MRCICRVEPKLNGWFAQLERVNPEIAYHERLHAICVGLQLIVLEYPHTRQVHRFVGVGRLQHCLLAAACTESAVHALLNLVCSTGSCSCTDADSIGGVS